MKNKRERTESSIESELKAGGYFRYKYNDVFAFYYTSLESEKVRDCLKTFAKYIQFRIYKSTENYFGLNEGEEVLLIPSGKEYKTVTLDRVIIVSSEKLKDGQIKYKAKIMKLETFEKNYLERENDEPSLFKEEEKEEE